MKLIINIPESMYEGVMMDRVLNTTVIRILNEIKNGTPLPKGHGRIIDESKIAVIIETEDGDDFITDAPTIIEADKVEGE